MKNLIKILFKGLILLIITCICWFSLTPIFRIGIKPDGSEYRLFDKNSLDVIVLGSSHAQYSFNPAVMYQESGLYSFVLGSGCQPVSISYNMLKEALKTQKPEVVFMDVFTLLDDKEVCEADELYYVGIQQMTGFNRLEAASYIKNKEKKYLYMFDLYMNHSRWPEIEFEKSDDSLEYSRFGYVSQEPAVFKYTPVLDYEVTEEVQVPENIKYIEMIKKLCDKEGITLVLYKSPYVIKQESANQLAAVWKWADDNGIRYVDFFKVAADIGFHLDLDSDTYHATSWGAEKITTYLTKYVVDNNLVSHHQNDSLYDESSIYAVEQTAQSLMNENQVDIYQLLEFAKIYPCTLLVKYTGADSTSITDYENGLLNGAGINFDFVNNKEDDYFALIENGAVIAESNTGIESDYNDHQVQINNNGIFIDSEFQGENGKLEIVFCDSGIYWKNVMDINYQSYFWKQGYNGLDKIE